MLTPPVSYILSVNNLSKIIPRLSESFETGVCIAAASIRCFSFVHQFAVA